MCSLTMKPCTFMRLTRISGGAAIGIGCAVVAGDHAAQGDAPEGVHAQHHGVEDHAADVLEVAVDAVRAGLLQRRATATSGPGAPCSRCRRRSRVRRRRSAHLSGPPAMPTARQPRALASWPTTLPTAPLAALTTTVSPALGSMICHQADPGRDARHADRAQVGRQRDVRGVDLAQHAALRCASTTEYCCQPPMPTTLSPAAKAAMLRFDHLADGAADHHLRPAAAAGRSSWRRSCARACTGRGSGSGGAPAPGRPAASGTGASTRRKLSARGLAAAGARRGAIWLFDRGHGVSFSPMRRGIWMRRPPTGSPRKILEGAGGVRPGVRRPRRTPCLRRRPARPCGAAACRWRRAGPVPGA